MMARRLPVRAFAGELQPKRNNARVPRESTTHKRTSQEDRLCDFRRSFDYGTSRHEPSLGRLLSYPHVETLAGINAELSGIDLSFSSVTIRFSMVPSCCALGLSISYVVGGGEADNVQDSEWSCRCTRTNHPSSVDILRRSAAGPKALG